MSAAVYARCTTCGARYEYDSRDDYLRDPTPCGLVRNGQPCGGYLTSEENYRGRLDSDGPFKTTPSPRRQIDPPPAGPTPAPPATDPALWPRWARLLELGALALLFWLTYEVARPGAPEVRTLLPIERHSAYPYVQPAP